MSDLVHKVVSVEAEIDLEELAEQLVERACGFHGPLTDSDLLEFILLIVADVNSDWLDSKLYQALGEYVKGSSHDV